MRANRSVRVYIASAHIPHTHSKATRRVRRKKGGEKKNQSKAPHTVDFLAVYQGARFEQYIFFFYTYTETE